MADITATTLHRNRDSQQYYVLQQDCADAGKISGDARRQVEKLTGEPVVSSMNYKQLQQARQQALQPPLLEIDEPENED